MKSILLAISILFTLSATTLTSIQFHGNKRTTVPTLLKMADMTLGDSISDSLLDRTSQRLLKSDLFDTVGVKADDSGAVIISVSEKWSIIPFVSFTGNGTSLTLNTGLYDANFLGKALTIGGGYTYRYGTHSGEIFSSKDNIGSHNLKLTGKIGTQWGINKWFNPNGTFEAGFVVNRQLITVSSDLPLTNKLTGTFSLIGLHDSISHKIGIYSFDSTNKAHGYTFSGSNSALVPQITLKYNNFRYNTFTYKGWGAKVGFGHAFESNFGGYNSFSLAAQWYKELPLNANLAFNGEFSGADGSAQTNLFYVGGMNGVRGFPDSFFRGKAIGKFNAEYRIPSVNTKWIVLQHVFFADYAAIAPRLSQMGKTISAESAGIGIRILSPKIYGFMIRLDYGWGIAPLSSKGLSFGTSHYFRPF